MPTPVEKLIQLAIRDNAATVIQQWWRGTSAIEDIPRAAGATAAGAPVTTKPADRTRLLRLTPPASDLYLTYASLLLVGDYAQLALQPENEELFDTHLLHALDYCYKEHDKDLTEGFATVKLLRNAFQWCHTDEYYEFAWTDNSSPYCPVDIGYNHIDMIVEEFYQQLSAQPLHEQNYFTINFPRKYTAYLFYLALQEEHAYFRLHLQLESFFLRLLAQHNPEINAQQLEDLTPEQFLNDYCSAEERDFCLSIIDDTTPENLKQEKESIIFFAELLSATSMPMLCLSPDFKASDFNSPLLSLVIPTTTSWNCLLTAAHGDDTVAPRFALGRFDAKTIRTFAEGEPDETSPASHRIMAITHGRGLYQGKTPLRPIELQDERFPRDKLTHELDCNPYVRTLHDNIHTWICSALHKRLLAHLRHLFEKLGPCHSERTSQDRQATILSTAIYRLADMGYSFANKLRALGETSLELKKQILFEFIETLGFNTTQPNNCINLLLLVDMACYPELWADFLFLDDPREFVALMNISLHASPLKIGTYVDYEQLTLSYYNVVNFLIEQDYPVTTPIELVILHYKLAEFNDASQLCDLLNTVGLGKLFYWGRNSGLYVKHELRDTLLSAGMSPAIDQLTSEQLYSVILKFLYQHAPRQYATWLSRTTTMSDPILNFFATNNLPLPEVFYSRPFAAAIDATQLDYLIAQANDDRPFNLRRSVLAPGTRLNRKQFNFLVYSNERHWPNCSQAMLTEDVTVFSPRTYRFLVITGIGQCEFFRQLAKGLLTETNGLSRLALQSVIAQLSEADLTLDQADNLCAIVLRFIHRSKSDFANQLLNRVVNYTHANGANLTPDFRQLCHEVSNPLRRDLHWQEKTNKQFLNRRGIRLSCKSPAFFCRRWRPNLVDSLVNGETVHLAFT